MKITKENKTYDIVINPKPDNCKECPFYLLHEDDECGDYNFYYCQFEGCKNNFGCYLQRPVDCPLDANPAQVNKVIHL